MPSSVTPPVLQGPTAKEKKYDRQLRLWAASGQEALENAHILLLNDGSGVTGIETLKNLVLPGVGAFTIVDNRTVKEEDLGVNFFLEESSLGKSRAEETCRFLLELNPEVKGYAVVQDSSTFAATADFSNYTLVILAAPIDSSGTESKIADILWNLRLPLVYIHSIGFYSHFSLQLPPSFPIVETHPDPTSTQDLRLLQPWPELMDYCKAQTEGLDGMSDHDHGHIPWLILLLHYVERWKESHDGKFDHRKDKSAFKDFLRDQMRTNNSEGGEENFEEALTALNRALVLSEVPSSLKAVLKEDEAQSPRNSVSTVTESGNFLTAKSPNFWLIANGISKFVDKHGVLPLPGAVPDMKAQSKDYIALQTLYRKKSQQDIAEVTESIRALEKALSRHIPIESKEIEAFCKGAAFVKLIRGRKIISNPMTTGWNDNSIAAITKHVTTENFVTGQASIFAILIAFYAFDSAMQSPTLIQSHPDFLTRSNTTAFKEHTEQYITAVFSKLDQSPELDEALNRTLDITKEMQRSGPGELHNIASLTGGMVAQEIIKVITQQYVPVNNCCIFDGIASSSTVFRL